MACIKVMLSIEHIEEPGTIWTAWYSLHSLEENGLHEDDAFD